MLFEIDKNGIQTWDLSKADSEAQHQFFDELLNIVIPYTFKPAIADVSDIIHQTRKMPVPFPVY